MFATSVKSKSTVISLYDVNIANELNLFGYMVACSHVFTLRIIENERSVVAVVGATTSKSLTLFSAEGIISQLSRLHCYSTSMISNVCEGLFFLQMLFKTSSSVLSDVTSTSLAKIFFILNFVTRIFTFNSFKEHLLHCAKCLVGCSKRDMKFSLLRKLIKVSFFSKVSLSAAIAGNVLLCRAFDKLSVWL